MSVIKAAVFDFGGVIINDLDAVYNTHCFVCMKLGKEPMQREHFDKVFSPDWIRLYREVGVEEEPEEIRKLYLEMSTTPKAHKDSLLYDGALDALKALKKSKILALNTGYRTDELALAFSLFNIDKNMFDAIMTEDRAGECKPAPATLLSLAEELGLEPQDMVFVGDTVTDIECGKNAGSVTVAVTWGSNDREDLEKADPDHIVNSWEELYSLLKEM